MAMSSSSTSSSNRVVLMLLNLFVFSGKVIISAVKNVLRYCKERYCKIWLLSLLHCCWVRVSHSCWHVCVGRMQKKTSKSR
jgi:hypothetical protein